MRNNIENRNEFQQVIDEIVKDNELIEQAKQRLKTNNEKLDYLVSDTSTYKDNFIKYVFEDKILKQTETYYLHIKKVQIGVSIITFNGRAIYERKQHEDNKITVTLLNEHDFTIGKKDLAKISFIDEKTFNDKIEEIVFVFKNF